MIDLVTLVVDFLVIDMFVDIMDVLVTNGISGFIVIIYTSAPLVPSSISPKNSVTGGIL